MMCRSLRVSRAGFYRWLSCPDSRWKLKRERIKTNVLDVYETFKARYGAPRIAEELTALGISCSKNYVANIMHSEGIRARNGKAFKYSRHSPAMVNVAKNIFGTFLDVDTEDSSPRVILQYIGPTSKHPEVSDVDPQHRKNRYPDDSCNVGETHNNPVMITPDAFAQTDFSIMTRS